MTMENKELVKLCEKIIRRMRRFGVVVTLLFIFFSFEAGAQKILVKNGFGTPLPNLFFFNESRSIYLITDTDGILNLDNIVFEDTLSFNLLSNYYSSPKFRFGELVQKKEILLKPNVSATKTTTISEKSIKEILEKASDHFITHYMKNYIAQVYISRFLYSDTSYQQIYLTYGLWGSFNFSLKEPKYYYEDQNSMKNYLPADSFTSNFYLPNTDKILKQYTIANRELNKLNSLKVNYHNKFRVSALELKRAIELYSPINKTHIDDYNYVLNSESKANKEVIYKINFYTKSGRFPDKTKLFGAGCITISAKGRLLSISVENMENRFSAYWNYPSSCLYLLTPYTFEMNYAQDKLGNIYTSSLKMETKWIMPENLKGNTPINRCFYIEENFYRNPFKFKLSTSTQLSFVNPKITDKTHINSLVKPYFKHYQRSAAMVNFLDNVVYIKNRNKIFWETKLDELKDIEKVKSDLYDHKYPLYEQSTNSYNIYKNWQSADTSNIESPARELYKKLYKKEYYE